VLSGTVGVTRPILREAVSGPPLLLAGHRTTVTKTANELSGTGEEQPKLRVFDEAYRPLPGSDHEGTNRMTNHWRQYARCLGADPELFYPPPESEDGGEAAKEICAVCPVREPCLEHAITAREKQGVWGGLDERERRRLVRQRRRSA
jgi:WhiB family transcriptional regulator, redox-sensing transcriptional regulator